MDAYLLNGDFYCEDCGVNEEGAECVANGGGEADSPQHCAECNECLENPLTDDGVRYVAEQIKAAHTDPNKSVRTINEWARVYHDDLTDRLPPVKKDAYAWPGGYPLVYTVSTRPVSGRKLDVPGLGHYLEPGQVYCAECAGKLERFTPALAQDVHWEGEPLECEDCGKEIDSAYGDPEAD
jgi:hypothetical protein